MGYRHDENLVLRVSSRVYTNAELVKLLDHIPLHSAFISHDVVIKSGPRPRTADQAEQDLRNESTGYVFSEGFIKLSYRLHYQLDYQSPTHDAVTELLKRGIHGVLLDLYGSHPNDDELSESQRELAWDEYNDQIDTIMFGRLIAKLKQRTLTMKAPAQCPAK